jgi:hypothetical protein
VPDGVIGAPTADSSPFGFAQGRNDKQKGNKALHQYSHPALTLFSR